MLSSNKIILALVLLLAPGLAMAQSKFAVKDSDFSNEKTYQLTIVTDKSPIAGINLYCRPGKELLVALATSQTIFPDAADTMAGHMSVNVTHKFDKSEKAHTTTWMMNLNQYSTAYYSGNSEQFIRNVIKSNRLNIRLDKGGSVYRLSLEGTAKDAREILSACGIR